MVRARSRTTILTTLLALALIAPGAAQAAASKPGAQTGSATKVHQQDATLTGSVNPKGAQTTYSFQYGTTRSYGTTTPATPAGNGAKALAVNATVVGLAPATRYHYRLVARSSRGTSRGHDRTFKTRKQPLGINLIATVNPVKLLGEDEIAGQITGTDHANRHVILQTRPWPYTQPFADVTNQQITDKDGNFKFPVIDVAINTQYQVRVPGKPDLASPIVSVGVKPYITTHAPKSAKKRGKYGRIHWHGNIKPLRDGAQVLVQKVVHRKWVTIGSTTARHRSDTSSKYSRTLRQRHGGQYRIVVNSLDGAYVSNVGRTHTVHLKH